MSSIVAEITKNLQDTLHLKDVEYVGETHTIYCDRERIQPQSLDRWPKVTISSPICEVQGRANKRCNCDISYLVTFSDERISDEPKEGESIASIDEITENILADLIKLIMADRSRGGYATNTTWDGFGSYFAQNEHGIPSYYLYIKLTITALINDTNPYERG